MKTLLHRLGSAMGKHTLRALGAYSLLTILVSGEARAIRVDEGFFIIPSEGTWTHVASACAVDEDSSDYKLSGAGVSFAPSSTGEITLRCNVDNVMYADSAWDTLEVVYRDPDGGGVGNQVTASLHAVSLNGAAESTTTVIDPLTGRPRAIIDFSFVAAFESNSAASAASAAQVGKIAFSHEFDFAQNAYYVKIKVKRAKGATTNPAAFIVRMYQQGTIGG